MTETYVTMTVRVLKTQPSRATTKLILIEKLLEALRAKGIDNTPTQHPTKIESLPACYTKKSIFAENCYLYCFCLYTFWLKHGRILISNLSHYTYSNAALGTDKKNQHKSYQRKLLRHLFMFTFHWYQNHFMNGRFEW